MPSIFYNAHHSPIGAFASFTLGYRGAKGGLGIELPGPADQNVYIGLETADGDGYQLLPFCELANGTDEISRYDVEAADCGIVENEKARTLRLDCFADSEISREFGPSIDTWHAGDLSFRLYSPVMPVPDPMVATDDELRLALVPAILAEITVDNRAGTRPRRAVLGFTGTDPYSGMRRLQDATDGRLIGVGQGRILAMASRDDQATSALGFSIDSILSDSDGLNHSFGLGNCAAMLFDTPAGELATFRVAIGFYRGGLATSGIDARYLYTRLFADIDEVCAFALDNWRKLVGACEDVTTHLLTGLSADQAFMLSHAVRSYYGSTQLLECEGKPIWVVNEGEYRMMNTFDLTVDQLFFEIQTNPWVLKNVLDLYVSRYSYTDEVRFPGDAAQHPGGLTFTHDMGVSNVFSRPGYSSYEQAGLKGCFSYMSHEQLVNWVLTACCYIFQTGDIEWRDARIGIIRSCLDSLINRDHPDPAHRDGIMSLDSARTAGGAEITTYDSLDESLGQARNNLYLAIKTWASYVLLEKLLDTTSDKADAERAKTQALRCAETVVAHADEAGTIPAVLEVGNQSRIIPAIEGLVFPYFAGFPELVSTDGAYSSLIKALKRHIGAVLEPGVCLFENGAWKLSSTSNNSWLSKIYLCQFVARQILGLAGKQVTEDADAAHVSWLLDPKNSYFAWSDQMLSGTAVGSRYYPRGVTAILWTRETRLR